MATITPFRGIRYNADKVADISQVITQPYDRIHQPEQAAYYAQHPYNYVRLIQGIRNPDAPDNNVYTRARAYSRCWQAEGILVQDPSPALYATEQIFSTPDGHTFTRTAFTAALRLTPFEEGTILPHERTLSGPKADRLNLLRATQTGWSSVFILYPDAENEINSIIKPYLNARPPVIAREMVIEPDVEQRFWTIDDPALIAAVVNRMAPKRNLIIADGHHRYETALNYQREMQAQHPDAPVDAPFNHVMATFVSMADPGLVILPTHRLVHSYNQMDSKALLEALQPYFERQPVADCAAMEASLAQAEPTLPRIGFYDGSYTVLTLRSIEAMAKIAANRQPSWRELDVAVLHELIIEKVMGLSKASVAAEENIRYLRHAEQGYAAVNSGEADFLFVLNPTRMEQVQSRSEAGKKMPQKSTDFYPKVINGLVALPLAD